MASEPPPRKRVTLADVAREAGVSVQTASHVMAGNMTVRLPASTRERVVAAAKRVAYQPNRLARAMKQGKTQIVAVWMPLDRPSMIFLRMLHGVSECARASGYDLMIISLDREMAYSAQGEAPNYWPVDGVIAIDAGKSIQRFREDPSNDLTPVSILGYEEYANADTVAWNVHDGAYTAVKRMIGAGCRKIVHVTLDWVIAEYPREQRRRGYTEAMEEAGLTPVFLQAKSESSEAAETATLEHIRSHGLPDAVFGFTDQMAIGAARALLGSGVDVPKDCWVVGFGDNPEALDFRVPLTSLRTPVEALMRRSWEWLMERIANPNLPARKVEFPMELIVRESTGPLDPQ